MNSYKEKKFLWSCFGILSIYNQILVFLLTCPKELVHGLQAGHTLQVSLPMGNVYLEATCNLGRSVYPAGRVSSSISNLFVGHCLSKSFKIFTAPPSLESTYYLSRQIVSPAIPTSCSHLKTNHIAYQI